MNTDHIKKRNMIMQVVLMIITLGIYAIYWYYSTLKELHIANGKDDGAGIWTLLSVIPMLNFFAQWHYSAEYNAFNQDRYPTILVFILWLVFSPAVWFLVQMDLNKTADTSSAG